MYISADLLLCEQITTTIAWHTSSCRLQTNSIYDTKIEEKTANTNMGISLVIWKQICVPMIRKKGACYMRKHRLSICVYAPQANSRLNQMTTILFSLTTFILTLTVT